jgi:nucleoside-diphosphate-sugar epimerase
LLVMGATGAVGGALRAAWTGAAPAGLCPLWQGRQAGAPPGWLRWAPLEEPLPALPPLEAVLVLSGVVPASGAPLSDNAALALAGLEAARAAGARHVFLASSQAVYAPAGHPLAEGDPVAPPTPYGLAKAEMEEAAARWQAAAGPGAPGVTCLRIGNVAGADLLGRRIGAGRPMRLDRFPDGRGPERSYIGVGGFARVMDSLLAAVLAGRDLPFALNIAAPRPVAMEDLLRAWGRDWSWGGGPPGARQSVSLDVAQLGRLHDFEAQDSDAAQMVAEWQRLGRA